MIFKTEKDKTNAFRNTFGTTQGRMVLVEILGMLEFFETNVREGMTPVEQNVLNLYAKKILMLAAGEEFGTIVNSALGLKPKKKTIFERIGKWLKQ